MKAQNFILFILTIVLINCQPSGQKNGTGLTTFASKDRIMNIDVQSVKGRFNTMFKQCVGAGRANEGLRADWQDQLRYTKKNCDFKYIRMHGLLTDDMGVYKEDRNGNSLYNWQYIDKLYDFLLSIHIKPFVELSFMPGALASGNQTVFWWRGNSTPPKDYGKWKNLIINLTRHFTERYGENEVSTWYFEVWNEPNLSFFWSGTQQEYFRLYDSTANAIKSVSKRYRVGGPATAGSAWVTEMINHCYQNHVPIDFISTHCYGVNQGYIDANGETGTIINPNPAAIYAEIINSRRLISISSLPNLELHYTEWSSSYTPTDYIHDTYFEASYILDKIKGVGNAANSMSYWVFTDIFEEAGPRFTPFHGGFGLINYQAINKPAFYAFHFLNKLGETELNNKDTASWACKNSKGDIQILFWNFTNTHPGDSTNDQVYYNQILPSRNIGDVKINIINAKPGKYLLSVYKTGFKVNDAFTTYLEMGSPSQLTEAQVENIKSSNDGSPIENKVINLTKNKSFDLLLNMRQNDVYLVIFKKL